MPERILLDWKKVFLTSIAIFALIAAGMLAGYWYGTQQAQTVKAPILVSQPTSAPSQTQLSTQGKIAFVRDGNIWVVNPDGSGERILKGDLETIPSEVSRKLIWSPDGRFLSWVYEGEGSAFHALHVLEIKTGELYQTMATGVCCSIVDYAWSPDGNNVAVLHLDKSGGGPPGYFVSIFSTGESFSQSNYLELVGLVPRKIAWKNEDKIHILSGEVSIPEEEVDLVEHNISDGKERSYFLGFGVEDFDLSPDGTKVAYITTADDGVCNLYLMDLKIGESGSIANNLDSGGLKGFQKVEWSPDGKYLALESALIDTGGVEVLDLLGNVLHKAEGDPRLLFNEVYKEEKPVQWSWSGFDWSPDSQGLLRVIHIIYPKNLPSLIVRYDLETGKLTKITTTDSFVSPVWSPAPD